MNVTIFSVILLLCTSIIQKLFRKPLINHLFVFFFAIYRALLVCNDATTHTMSTYISDKSKVIGIVGCELCKFYSRRQCSIFGP